MKTKSTKKKFGPALALQSARMRWTIRTALYRLNWEEVATFVTLAFAIVFHQQILFPQEEKIRTLEKHVSALKAQSRAASPEKPRDADPLEEFKRKFPPAERVEQSLGELFAEASKQNISVEQAEYRSETDGVSGLMRFQIMMPVKGTYPQVRQFIGESLSKLPNLSLDQLNLSRSRASDAAINAELRFSLFFRTVRKND